MNNSQMKTNTLPAKLKAERPMPKWVTEANERIGPKPPASPPNTINGTPRPPALPPKKNQLEPDYEVIEFSGQQYSNEPMRPKTPDTRRPESAMKCTLCGSNNPWVTCDECAQQIFCASCDDMFHKHPKRKTHLRKAIEFQRSANSAPLIPPKAAPGPQAPVAPPRRNKRGMPSPMPLRRDQVIGSPGPTPTVSPVPGQPQAWQDRLGSLKRGLNLSMRPLPETPRTPSDGVSSRSTTPNSKSVFDAIQRPPSITLEKIKNKASATLDRMALLQQRYRQHKEMKANGQVGGRRDQLLPSDQWSNLSSSPHFRSGSMSSGINSFDFPDDPPFHFHQQMGMRNSPAARNMSSSVFNLNQVSQRPTDHHSPMWMGGSQMQQAQSMAQLNCINCTNQQMWNQPQQHDEWPGASNTNLNRSQMSLNMAHGFYPAAHPQQMMHPPPIFMNMPGMYPYPLGVGMPAMNPGLMGMPSSTRSRATSRAGSRVPSPTLSRKSIQMRKKRNNYPENDELTDDEDSDNDDRRSLISQRSGLVNQRRTRRVSSASQVLPLEEEEEPRSFRSKALNSRDRRGASIPKSVQSEWTPPRRPSTASTNFNSYKKVYSDSPISPDSEASEAPPTRALVQRKIQEKLKESTKPSPPPKAAPLPESFHEAEQLPTKNSIDDNQYQNSSELKLVVDQNEEEIIAEDLGPPPSTPEHEWECEFCTFVNEAKTKICSICCKTPINPIPKVETATAAATPTAAATVSNVTNGIGKLKLSQSEEESEDYTGAKKKDNATVEDIWATLDENIQAEANKVKRNAELNTINKSKEQASNVTRASGVANEKKIQKVSTGCGPSPPNEIVKEQRSTATSSTPQTISTQTYDCIPTRNATEQEAVGTSTEMRANEHQSQSYTPPTRNFSPKETYAPVQDMAASREAEHFANMERNLQFYRDMSVTQADRYRSSNDIRFDEHPPSVGQRRPSVSDYLASQKAQMYHTDNFFDQYAVSKRNEPTRDPEVELFMLLKEAEHYKFTAEELHAALKHCGDTHPIVWLRENWSKLVQTVQSLATKYGQERIENVIGTISAIEAREALRMHGGNVWQAISECVEQRQRKYLEISAKGNYSREDIVTALTAHHGNLELALLDLSKTQLKPFLMRVWGSPGGVENDSANYMLPPPPPPKTEVNSAIHEFLSANADQLTFTQDQAHFRNTSSISNLSSWSHESKDEAYASQNKNVLRDLEILISNMEQVQAKQSGQLLRSVEHMLGNLLAKKPVEADIDAESERIFMKSPILSQKIGSSSNATDVKNFVWQHIQDIVPNLVEQVEKELLEEPEEEKERDRPEPPPIDADQFIMEEVIKPNLKHSTMGEEPQMELHEVEAMSKFLADTDRSSPIKQKEEFTFKSFANAPRSVFKMAIAPESSSEEESSEDESSRAEIPNDAIIGVQSRENTKNEPNLVNQDDDKEVQGQSSEDESSDSQRPSTSVQEKPPTEGKNVLQNEELPSSKGEQNSSDAKQASDVHETAPNAEDVPLSNEETEGEAIESDELETKADKGWGFKGFSFRIGFNSFGRSRRQRTRRSVKREKRQVESENDNMRSSAAPSVEKVQVETKDVASVKGENVFSDNGAQIQSAANELVQTMVSAELDVVEVESVRDENTSSVSSDRAEEIQSAANEPVQAPQSITTSIPAESAIHSEQSKEVLSAETETPISEPTSTKSTKSARKSSSLPKLKQTKHKAATEPSSSGVNRDDPVVPSSSSAKGSTPSTFNKTDQGSTLTNLANHKTSTEESDLKVAVAHTPSKMSKTTVEKVKQTTETEVWKTNEDAATTSPTMVVKKAKTPQIANTNSKIDMKPSDGVKPNNNSVAHKNQQNSFNEIRETDKVARIVTEEASTSSVSPTKPSEIEVSESNKETPKPSSSSNSKTTIVNSKQQTPPNTQMRNEAEEHATAINNAKVTELHSAEESIVSVAPTDSLKAITSKKTPVSRIPIRRIPSSASLRSTESIPTSPTLTPNVEELPQTSTFKFEQQSSENGHQFDDDEFFDDIQSSSEEEPDFHNAVEEIVQLTTVPAPAKDDGENSDQELYSVGSDELSIENARYQMQSPTSESEVLLILENEQSHMSLVTPSTSSSTITGVSNKSIDFKYADPSKQNLTELVEDTQRLIKQMKEEINIDMAAFDSEDDYSEDYSYEEYEEDYEDEEKDDNVNDDQEYEDEETENEDEDYSNIELNSEGEETYEHGGSLKDLEEVDEIQYIEEPSQITLSHRPSTDHSPSIVDSSISKESLTKLSHVINTDHNEGVVLAIPGLLSGGSIPSETEHIEVVESNEMSEPPFQEAGIPDEIEARINSFAPISNGNDNASSLSIQSPEQIVESIEVLPAQEESTIDVLSSTNAIVQRTVLASQIDIVLQKPAEEATVLPVIENNRAADESIITPVATDSRTRTPSPSLIYINSKAAVTPDSMRRSTSRSPEGNSSSEASNIYPEVTERNNAQQILINIDDSTQSRSPTPNATNRVSPSLRPEKDSLSSNLGDGTSPKQRAPTPDTSHRSVTPVPLEERSISEHLVDSSSPTQRDSTPDASDRSVTSVPVNTEGSISTPDSNWALASATFEVTSVSEKLAKTDNKSATPTLDTSNMGTTSSPSAQDNVSEKLSNTERVPLTGTEMLVPLPVESTDTPALITALEQLLHPNNNDDKSNAASPQAKEILNETKEQKSTTQTFPDTEKNLENLTRNVETPSSSSSKVNISVPPEGKKQSEEADDVPSTSKARSPRKSPSKKIASKIPKLNVKPQNPVPTRSKSFSGPSPIGISSVRAIQQELFNKPKPATQLQKTAPATLVRKKSIIDAISKFTQVTTEHPVQRSRTQPKIPKLPKKKYHETCFSDDDYQATTSEDEAPPPLEVRLRKQSAPVFRTYPSIQEFQIEKPEVLARRFVDEKLVANLAEAHLAAALVGMKFQQDVSIWAAKECADLDQAISMLQQDCELCMGFYPMNQIVSMLKCTHKCCKVCAKNYFTIQITDRSINDCNCPFCKAPELHDPNINEDENLEYFSNLDIFIKNIVEPEVHELFQRKLRDRTLMQDPNFKWCIQCSSGFFARPKQKRLICPDCGSVTCSQCRKTWEKQHETLSCEKFQEWKEANDPEVQAKGVADHLAINGIDCPKCHFKYSLARGGCMHFTCTQCKFEFCYGCSRPFMMGAKCTISPYCSKLGLHSHHPRSCLFYLRDKDPGQLQNLLKQNNVAFDVDPAGYDKESGARSIAKCPIPLQKETPKGLVDTVCNADVQLNHAGLCRQHYVEYLAGKVSKAGIDPLPILDLTDCVQELRRRGLPLPERGPWDTDEIYRNMCSKIISEKIPIE